MESELVERLIARRDALLKEKPWLQATQDKIDRTLEIVGPNPADRCLALLLIMQQMTNTLSEKVGELLPDKYLKSSKTNQS